MYRIPIGAHNRVHKATFSRLSKLEKTILKPKFLARAIIDSRSHVLVFSLLSPGVARWCWRVYPDSTRQTGPVICYMRGSNRRDKGVLSIFSIPLVAFSYHDVLDCSKAIEGYKSKAWDRRPKDHHERTLMVIYWRKEHWNTGGGRNKARGGKCMEITIKKKNKIERAKNSIENKLPPSIETHRGSPYIEGRPSVGLGLVLIRSGAVGSSMSAGWRLGQVRWDR